LVIEKSRVIVGIGASAGGIEAFRAFLENLPSDSGMSFVIVLHLSPDHPSMLSEILGRWTDMPVQQAVDGVAVEADHVHVMPPNAILTIEQGRLRLKAQDVPRWEITPIDTFFSSLAIDQRENAVGIVLSGTGSDGALGLRAIKNSGGITLAQGSDGTGPQYSGMPHSAIATGAVDLVVPVSEMPKRIASLRQKQIQHDRTPNDETLPKEIADARLDVCSVLRHRVGHDFSKYKHQTFLRRVQRRMHVLDLDAAAYLDYIRDDQNEAGLLFRDLLIGVTGFFREAETFAAVEHTVLPQLFKGKSADDCVRVWVPGCATGEEAYSLAILLREYVDKVPAPPNVQIFATDIDEPAIGVARAGRYPRLLLQDLPEARVARFFKSVEGTYAVTKEIRDLCTFSAHSVIRDPPFSRMDLVSCRNLLIYLDADLQGRVIPAFHYSLLPGGFLLLGGSETVTRYAELFDLIDKKHRIFRGRDIPSPPLEVSAAVGRRSPAPLTVREFNTHPPRVAQVANTHILDRFAPAFVVVNAVGDIVHYSARTGKYLEAAVGAPSRNLLSNARHGLRAELRTALRKATESGHRVERPRVIVEFDEEGLKAITLTIERLPGYDPEPHYVVVFADAGPILTVDESSIDERGQPNHDEMLQQLERDLRDTKEELQATVEEYETSLEEVKSANEELHSVNEELQSTNEELETSKEEIQSMNEELQTVNAQLIAKVGELDAANSDLQNLFEGTQVATVFLDRHMIIRGFTPTVGSIFNLIPSDEGRPITDIVSHLDYDDLRRDLRHVMDRLEPFERRLVRRDGNTHYLMRILPYRSTNNAVDGALVTFVDVTSVVHAEETLRVAKQHRQIERLFTVIPDAVIVLDRNGIGQFANEAASVMFEKDVDSFVGNAFEYPIKTGEVSQVQIPGKDGQRTGQMHVVECEWAATQAYLAVIVDITERKRAERLKDEFVSTVSHELRTPLTSIVGALGLLTGNAAGELPEPVARMIATALKNSQRLARLIDDILDTEKLELGKLVFDSKRIDVGALIEQAIEANRGFAESYGVQIRLDDSSVAANVYADPDRLMQVVTNLLSNAIKYSPSGQDVVVAITNASENVRISIRDRGPGIPEDFKPHIFEKFARADQSDSRKSGGTGLGLSIAKQIVDRLDGYVDFEDAIGGGTIFNVSLPRSKGRAEE
jgi:two-component system, chemotaxis family, CheB/CheR fusion protein